MSKPIGWNAFLESRELPEDRGNLVNTAHEGPIDGLYLHAVADHFMESDRVALGQKMQRALAGEDIHKWLHPTQYDHERIYRSGDGNIVFMAARPLPYRPDDFSGIVHVCDGQQVRFSAFQAYHNPLIGIVGSVWAIHVAGRVFSGEGPGLERFPPLAEADILARGRPITAASAVWAGSNDPLMLLCRFHAD